MWRAVILCMVLPLGAAAQDAPVIPNLIAPADTSARISVTVDPGLRTSNALRPELRRARAALHAGNPVSAENLRRLAQAGDGLAAQRYVRVLSAKDNADPSDIAYFAAIAVGTGRIWTLEKMIEAMHRLDPGTEPRARIRKYIRVLYPHAWAGNSVALQAVVDFNGEGRLFGPLTERTRQRIEAEAREQGDGRIELGLAVAMLKRTRAIQTPDPAELDQARSLLLLAEASDHLAVRTTAQNLLRLMDEPPREDS